MRVQTIGQDWEEYPAAAADLHEGAMLGINSSGYAAAWVLGMRFIGHAKVSCLNAANSAGDLYVRVYRGKYRARVALTNVAITDAIYGSAVYALDSGTLSLRIGFEVGKVVRYISSGIAVVEFDTNPAICVLSETMLIADFTDNAGTATGFKDMATQLPAYSQVLGWETDTKTGFGGDTSAVIQVGIAGTLAKFSAVTTVSVYTAIRGGCQSPVASNNFLLAATTVRATITGAADFTTIATAAAGELDLKMRYLPPSY
jgi:hypothetical protein